MLTSGVLPRPRLWMRGKRPPSDEEFTGAVEQVRSTGLCNELEPYVDLTGGRPGTIPLRALLVCMQLNAMAHHHKGHVAETARTMVSLSCHQQMALGLRDTNPETIYKRVDRKFNALSRALQSLAQTEPGIVNRFVATVARSTIDPTLCESRTVAIDGTDLETSARLRAGGEPILDGDAEYPNIDHAANSRKRTARVLGVGSDGRNIYTADTDARAGHRSATNSRAAGLYVGYEVHTAVQARDVTWTDYVERVKFGPPVPAYIVSASVVPAGTHRGGSAIPMVESAVEAGWDIREVVWDGGYSLNRAETTILPLARMGIQSTFRPYTHQRPLRPFRSGAVLIDGGLFSDKLPPEFRKQLPTPPRGCTDAEARTYERPFNARAHYRYVRHRRPDNLGYGRFKCPFEAGLVWNRSLRIKRKPARNAPTAALPPGTQRCCQGVLTIGANEIPLWQPIPAYTTAHRRSYGRRAIVENVNAALKGQFVTLDRQFMRVFGTVKRSILLAFTIAGYNLHCSASFRQRNTSRTPDRSSTRQPAW
jgi:hypothetical protein